MSYLNDINVKDFASGSTITDAFNRMKVSEVRTLFDCKQITGDTMDLFFVNWESGGSGTSTSESVGVTGTASTSLTVGNATAGVRTLSTKRLFNYQSGKGQEIFLTFVLGASASGIERRVGYFDDDNGVFLEQTSSALQFVVRTSTSGSAVDSATTQANWNYDKLDGTGRSGLTLDASKAQILVIDFEWLGVGSVRFGFVINGAIRWAHFAHHSNSVTDVYMSNPNLPLRYEIENTGAGSSASLKAICCTVMSQGGQEETGITRYFSRGSSTISRSSGSYTPLLSLRLGSTKYPVNIKVISVSVLLQDASDAEWRLWLNPTIGGTDGASWSTQTNSALEVDITRGATNTLSGGIVLDGGYISGSNFGHTSPSNITESTLTLGWDYSSALGNKSDQLVLAIQPFGANIDIYGGLTVRELL